MAKATFTVHLSLYQDETSLGCRWHLPETHFLEAWSDILASDGTATIIQPTIDPLYAGKSMHEVLAMLTEDFQPSGYEAVRTTWKDRDADFETFWQRSVHDGVIKNFLPFVDPSQNGAVTSEQEAKPTLAADADYLLIRADPSVGDGRWANNGWLQELPKPLTKLTWDNAALIGPAMAGRLGLKTGDVVELRVEDRAVDRSRDDPARTGGPLRDGPSRLRAQERGQPRHEPSASTPTGSRRWPTAGSRPA